MKEKRKLLVIDDDINDRIEHYIKIFRDFDLSPCHPSDSHIKNNLDESAVYNAILLDMYLAIGAEKKDDILAEQKFKEVIELIAAERPSTPLILISSMFDECSHYMRYIFEHNLTLITIVSYRLFSDYLGVGRTITKALPDEDLEDYLEILNSYITSKIDLIQGRGKDA